MIIKENITLYICQHCKKRMLLKHAMEKHEAACYSNPENFRACTGCANIEEIELTYEKDCIRLGENLGVIFDTRTVNTKGFRCKKLDKIMYPYKAEKKGLPDKYPESFEGQEPMPKTCEHFFNSWEII